jgi:glycosyltransferase involved in cell wall biosynthesis
LRIAILGTHGIPARYGGFETCVEEVAVRLVERGHQVAVYSKAEKGDEKHSTHKGVELVRFPKLRKQALDYGFQGVLTTAHAAISRADVLHFFGCDHVPFTLLGRLARKGVVLTVDGLEWKRKGYPLSYRVYLRSFAELAMVFPNVTVADSKSSQKWYYERTSKNPTYIPYGTTISTRVDPAVLERYGLEVGKYALFVGRLVFEKGAHTLIEAFRSVKTDLKLVMVGDALTPGDYVRRLREKADNRVVFLGYVHGAAFETVRNAALVYIHPSIFEGTSISLLGALGAGKGIVSSDLQENIDVAQEAAIYFKKEDSSDLSTRLQELLNNPNRIEELSRESLARARELLNWEKITDAYEGVYRSVLRNGRKKS